MTQTKEQGEKVAELSAAFLGLNDKGQDSALTILKTLRFAQSVLFPTDCQPRKPPPLDEETF